MVLIIFIGPYFKLNKTFIRTVCVGMKCNEIFYDRQRIYVLIERCNIPDLSIARIDEKNKLIY